MAENNNNSLFINGLYKKALFSAFFCAHLFLLTNNVSAQTSDCSSEYFDEQADVEYVHDGDTIRLNDKRKIRLIGIDTPELARNGKPEQPYARAAKNALRSLLSKNNNRVNLLYGSERKDRYNRTLAHLFLDDGRNVQSELLSRGLAIAYTTPPNTGFSDCYSAIEKTSKQKQLGIWHHEKYQPLTSDDLSNETGGFHIIESTVKNINITEKNIWITLTNDLNIQIRQKDRHYFDIGQIECLHGKTMRIRGWLHPRKKGAYMSLRHPSALSTKPENACN